MAAKVRLVAREVKLHCASLISGASTLLNLALRRKLVRSALHARVGVSGDDGDVRMNERDHVDVKLQINSTHTLP